MENKLKQKQIEELMKDMCADYPCNRICDRYCGMYDYAERAINAGYSKIHENVVVLTREEYEKLKDEKADNILANVDKVFKAEFADMKNSVIRRINKDYAKKVRKETVEKFARLVEFHSVSTRDNDGREIFTISALWLKEILTEEFGFKYDEIAKELTGGDK